MTESTATMKFVRFIVQRCIRVIYDDDGHVLRPVHPQQDEELLNEIKHDIGPGPCLVHRHLIEIDNPEDGETYACVVPWDSDLYQLADANTAVNSRESTGTFGQVWWRVLGYVESEPNEGYALASGDCETAVTDICRGLQALLPTA